MRDRVWSVGELIRAVNGLLEQGFSGVTVEGEVTNVSASSRGHLYFTLKDDAAALDCAMWVSSARKLKYRVEDGLAVLATGKLTIYPQRGRFQMVVEELEPQGMGALQLAFEQLKERLAAEGLFAEERKRPLPALPNRVGVVTSATGAALQDMLKVFRRCPNIVVILAPTRVQGDEAAGEIADAIRRLGSSGLVKLLIVGRGGGSLEDLWAFNEEVVARAIAACPVPVVSGVGHEVDFTIADFVADLRAATPTQAAEIVVARLEEQARRVADLEQRLDRDLRRHLALAHARLRGLEGSSGLARLPQRLALFRQRVARAVQLPELLRRLAERSRNRLERAEHGLTRLPARITAGGHRRLIITRREQLAQLMRARLARVDAELRTGERSLEHLSPRRVLERGYSITTIDGHGKPLKDAAQVRPGQAVVTTLARGEFRAVVASSSATTTRGRTPRVAEQASLFDDAENPEPSGGRTR